MHEQPGISDVDLRACLQEQYGLPPVTLDFLPLGLDYRAGVYRMVSEQGVAYLLKVKLGPLYEPGCLVPGYLRDQGIASVVAPLPTKSGTLWARLEGWTVIVYPFIVGDTNWTGMTEEQRRETGSIFRRIHQVKPPSDFVASLRRETFDPTEYARKMHVCEAQYVDGRDEGGPAEQALRSFWQTYRPTIHAVVAAMERLAAILQGRELPYVLCHADLHPANLLRAQTGQVFVIDWDEVMLAPRERDFIFVQETAADNSTTPFFQGYGQVDIDWPALAYFRYERVIQDVIECAQQVFFRSNLDEEIKADAAQLCRDVLMDGGSINIAAAAAARLAPDLVVHPVRTSEGTPEYQFTAVL